jgi:hypothetical protein
VHLVVICSIEVGERDVVLESGVAPRTGVIGLGKVSGLSVSAAAVSLVGDVDRSERRLKSSSEDFLFADVGAVGSGAEAFGGVAWGGVRGGGCSGCP